MDIGIAWDTANCRGDWSVANYQLVLASPLESAVYVSLFSHRRAPPDWPDEDPQGWWGDTYEDYAIGSWLWLLRRAKKYDGSALLTQAASYCTIALQWLIDDGVVASVSVKTWWVTRTLMGINVAIEGPSISAQSYSFTWAWAGL